MFAGETSLSVDASGIKKCGTGSPTKYADQVCARSWMETLKGELLGNLNDPKGDDVPGELFSYDVDNDFYNIERKSRFTCSSFEAHGKKYSSRDL